MHLLIKKFFYMYLIILTIIVIGCGGGGAGGNTNSQAENGKNTITATDGGTVSYNNTEVRLTIPENSLPADADIAIESIQDVPSGGADGLQAFGQAYKFTPAGTTFELSNPAIMEIEYDETLLASKGYSPQTLGLYYYDEQLKDYVAVASYVDIVNKKIIALVEHFTIYLPMAKAKLNSNNVPYVALQNPIPNPIRAGSPIYVRATVRDYDGSLAGVKLFYRKLNPVLGAWNQAIMKKEIRPNVLDTYGYIIPSNFLSSSDLGAGNDIEYYVTAVDNLGAFRTSATRRFDVTRTYTSGSLSLTPAVLDIVAGFERYFTARGIDNNGTSFQMIPDNFSLTLNKGLLTDNYAGGLLFHANTVTLSGSPEILQIAVGGDTASASINIYSGELVSIEILDTNGQKITSTLNVKRNSPYNFDAVGYDEFGNKIPVYPLWNADATIGTIDTDGKFTANTANNTGKVYISLGNFTDEQSVNIFFDDNFKIAFQDIDEESGKIGGTVTITKPDDETDITGYKIYWGSDNNTKLAGESAITVLPKTGNNITYNISQNTTPPEGVTHVLCFLDINGTESSFFSSCLITDLSSGIAPTPGGAGIVNIDSKTATKIAVSWNAATDDITPSSQLEYSVYYSTNINIDTVSNAQVNGQLAKDWTTDITPLEMTGLLKNTNYYIAVFVRDSGNNVSSYVKKSVTTNGDFPIEWSRTDGDILTYNTVITGVTGEKKKIAGEVYSSNITTISGAHSGIRAQFGYGPAGNSCINNNQWIWNEATFFEQTGNNDRYFYELTLPSAGSYEFVIRFSGDGGETWVYADTYGTNHQNNQIIRPFDPALQGKLTVN